MTGEIDISVITATWQRPQLLALCLRQFQLQELGELTAEQIVVSDGLDLRAAATAGYFGVRFIQLEKHHGGWGAPCNDAGLALARGQFVCFWNDDNVYKSDALTSLHTAVQGVDIGICRAIHWHGTNHQVIPAEWHGHVKPGELDCMCVIVRRELAVTEKWTQDGLPYDCDYRWLRRLQDRRAKLNFSPVIIGEHL